MMSDSHHVKQRDVKAVLIAVALSAGIALVVGGGAFLWSEIQQTREDNAALANQVRSLGGTPTVAPEPVKGMSPDQVRGIVTEELGKYKVTLTRDQVSTIASAAAALVPKPENGTTPTAAQVQGVVSATIKTFCAQSSSPCQGQTGPKGKDAAPITADQLRDAVAAFCGEDAVNCRGKTGPAGRGITSIAKSGETVTVTYTDGTTAEFTVADGAPGGIGPAGRGITKTECQQDGTWLFTYTDGSTSTTDGPCRALPAVKIGN